MIMESGKVEVIIQNPNTINKETYFLGKSKGFSKFKSNISSKCSVEDFSIYYMNCFENQCLISTEEDYHNVISSKEASYLKFIIKPTAQEKVEYRDLPSNDTLRNIGLSEVKTSKTKLKKELKKLEKDTKIYYINGICSIKDQITELNKKVKIYKKGNSSNKRNSFYNRTTEFHSLNNNLIRI